MSDRPAQTFEHHTRWVPIYHFVAGPIFLGLFVWRVMQAVSTPTREVVARALFIVAVLILFLMARRFAMRVQDRVIRLEEQLRFQRLLPADLTARLDQFTPEQFVALRFASDAELPDLARTVLEQSITDQKRIKSLIRTWRPDYLRA
ncbi:MAG: DUF6526 family protein [Gemmatimonadota bacterium]